MPSLAVSYASFQQYLIAFHGTDTSDEDAINADELAVSLYINQITGRFFGRDPEPVERTYRVPTTSHTLYVDDMSTDPESVTVDGVAITDYELRPYNAPLGPRAEPYRLLYRHTTGFTAGSLVVVSCRWGWPGIPPEIVRATIEITGILRRESPRATSRYEEGIAAFVSESSASKQIVDRLINPFKVGVWFA